MEHSCCFFGHRDVFENIENELMREIERLIDNGVMYFYVGGMGDFDRMAEMLVRVAKLRYPKIKLYLIKPYFSNELNKNKLYYEQLYDDVIIPTELQGVHYKAAIKKRNQWMISQCEYVVCYLRREFGGAYDAVKFATQKSKTIIKI